MHVGNIRTALFNYLEAKRVGAEFILRLDDTDQERSSQNFIDQIKRDLEWLGISWDRIEQQSLRMDRYWEVLTKLKDQNVVYECFETALELSDGRATVVSMDDEDVKLSFSARFSCLDCGHSIEELEPRLFSFNSPTGACPSCDGLGIKQYFDANLIITDSDSSLSAGAIRGWDRRNLYYFHMLKSLASHYDFDIDKPYKILEKRHKDIILFGSGTEEIEFNYISDKGTVFKRQHPFEGIIPNMERRYRETESNSVREELAKFLSISKCSSCDGTRLTESARHVLINEKSLPDITRMSISSSHSYFKSLKLDGNIPLNLSTIIPADFFRFLALE